MFHVTFNDPSDGTHVAVEYAGTEQVTLQDQSVVVVATLIVGQVLADGREVLAIHTPEV